MNYFFVELSTVSPLAMRSDYAQGGAQTAQFITGTTFAGSLAVVHRLVHRKDIDEFAELFLRGQVHYPNLYPALVKSQEIQDRQLPVYPVPRTAQSCKRYKGFRKQFIGDEEERHGVRDTLFDWAIFHLLEGKVSIADQLSVLRRYKICQVCGAPMDRFEGYYRRERFDPYDMISPKVDTRLQTHTGINRARGTVQENVLYNRQVIEEDMRFWGAIKVPDILVEPFITFMEEVQNGGKKQSGDKKQSESENRTLIRIGTGRTRGLGKVALKIESPEEESRPEDRLRVFKERLVTFDQAFRQKAAAFNLEDLKPFYFALTLHSPLILYDPQLRYLGSIDEQALAELVNFPRSDVVDFPKSNFERIYQVASVRRVAGWHDLWGTPRTNEYAIDTGSVFLFAASVEDRDELMRRLFELEEQGAGQRRGEGFGCVCISDPFHSDPYYLEGKLR